MSNFEVRLPCHDDSDYILTHFSLFSDDAAKEQKWQNAMNEEITSIEKNNTWELIDLYSEGQSLLV